MNRWLTSSLVLLSTVLSLVGQAAEPEVLPGDRVFGVANVLKFELTMSDKQFAALTPAAASRPMGFGPPREQPEGTHRNTFGVDFPWSQGDLTFDSKTYKAVGVRYKGNYTFMATARSLKKSMKLDFNRNLDGQKLDGLTMLNLHCGVSDPTRSREALSFDFFRDAGVPAPRTCFAELTLTVPEKYDRELVGLYTVTEQVNKGFLKRHFGDGKGMLLKPEGLQGGPTYLGSNWKPYADRYKPEDEPSGKQKQRLTVFTNLISNASEEEFAREIGTFLDLEAFLRFIAANVLLSNLDSYLGFGHNYYLYLIPATDKFVFIPWDLDLSLATWPALGTPEQLVRLSIHHPHAGQDKLLDRLFAITEHKDRYLEIIRELTASAFTRQKLLEHLEEIERAMKQPLAQEAAAVAARNEGRGAAGFGPGMGNGQFGQSMPPRRFIEKRIDSVASQLAGTSKGFEPKRFSFGPPPGGGFGPPRRDPK